MKAGGGWKFQSIPAGFWVALAVALGPLVLVGRELVQGKALFWGTPALQFVPWWMEALRQLQSGQLPLWNALNGMGAPLLANYQSAFFYPPNWLLCPLGLAGGAPWVAWGYTFLAMLHLAWGGWGMSAFLRRSGASALAQAVGGMAYALTGYFIGRMEFISMVWVGAWIPWVLRWADELASPVKHKEEPTHKPWLSLPLAACLAMQLLAGHAQLTWYTIEFAAAWVALGALLEGGWKALARDLGRFAAAGLVAALLASIQLIPTFEYLSQSQRASEVGFQEALTYSFWPWRFLSIIAPDFFGNPGKGNYWGYASFWEDHLYIGMLPFILALGSLPRVFKRREGDNLNWLPQPAVRLLWAVILVGALFALGSNTPLFPFLYRHIPSFDMFQAPARYMVWLVLALILLAASQVDAWRYPRGKGLYWLRLGTAGAFAVTLGAGAGWLSLHDVKLTFVLALAQAGFWALGTGALALLTGLKDRPAWKVAWPCLVAAWTVADLLAAGWYLNPMVKADFYAGTMDSLADARSMLGDKRIYLSRKDEYSLKFDRFLRFEDYRSLEDRGRMRTALLPNLNLLEGVALAGNFDPIVPARYAAWMKLADRASGARLSDMLRRMNTGLVEVLDPVSLAGVRYRPFTGGFAAAWFECARFHPTGTEALLTMARRSFSLGILQVEDPARTGQGCSAPNWQPLTVQRTGSAGLRIETNQTKAGWVFLSQTWYPGWVASIDGQPAAIYRADYTFMAVEVPPGRHKIVLQYRPFTFYIGELLSILVLVGLLGTWIFHRRKPRLI